MGDRYITLVYLSILTALLISEVTCNAGNNCTANTECGGNPAGTGYQCDESNTCQCTTDYYEDPNKACVPKIEFGSACDLDNQCRSTLFCKNNTQENDLICECDNDDYFEHENKTCKNKPGFNGPCTSTTGCLGNLICSSNICSCDSKQYHDGNNKCLSKPGYDGSCNSTTGCLGNLTCSSEICSCDSTQYYDVDSKNCVSKQGFNGTCTNTTGCLGNLTCSSEICSCDSTQYHDDNNNCLAKHGINETCTDVKGCLGNLTCLSGDICGCDDDDHYNKDNQCLSKQGFNGTCTNTTGCLGNLTCSSEICSCDSTQYHDDNNNCLAKHGINETCTDAKECLGNLTCLSGDICGCDDDHYNKDNQCLPKPGFNGTCNSTTGCLGNLTCSSETNPKCGCNVTHYHIGSNNCLPKHGINETCTNTKECLGNLTCLSGGICGCDDDHYNKDNQCLPKHGINETCTDAKGCLGNLTCLPDPSGICGCDDDHYNKDNQCLPKHGINETCTDAKGCLGNLTCLTGGICGCDDDHYNKDNQCLPRKGYGEGCTTVDSCSVVNGGCYTVNNTCSCNSNYYTDNNQCKSVDELKPTGITTGALTSSSVTISWSVPQKDAVISFNIKGTGPNIETSVMDKAIRTYTVTGLTPNTQYTAVTVETVVRTDRNPSLVVTSDQSLLTFTTPRAGYREQCVATATDQCSVQNTECINLNDGSKCYCQVGFYTNNNKCFNVDELKPTGITTGDLTSSSVTISWSVPQKDAVISFNIKGTGPNIETSVIDKTIRTYTVTGLTPNTQYTAVTVETVVKTDRNPSLVVTSDQSLLTFTTPKAGYREQCVATATDQCSVQNTECIDLNDGSKCYCKVGFYTNNNQCFNASNDLKPTHNGADPKTTSATVDWILGLPSNIQFISNFTIEVNGIKKKENIGNTATSSEITNLQPGTTYNIVIVAIVNTDRNSNYEVKSDQISIITKQESGGSCDMSNPQCSGNLTCNNSKCGCLGDQYLYNDNCYSKLDYGGDCSNSNAACKEDLLCYDEGSVSRCRCILGRYRSGNQCKLVSDLKPTSFEVTDSTSNNLTFSWDILNDTYISSYVISGDNFPNKPITNTARTGTVTSLSPGTDYTNIKITAKVKTGRGNTVDDAVSDTILTDYTNPGIPGALDSNNVYNSTVDMIIRFGKPTGGVDKYIVKITGPGLDNPFTGEPTTNVITVPANTLLPGRTYTISIIAVYKEKNSVEFTGTIKTQTGGSGPVRGLAITDIKTSGLTVSWSYPANDSGPLTAYILDVKKNGNECVQQFIYLSDINNKLPRINCLNQTPTYNATDLTAGVRQELTDLLPYTNYTLTVTPYNGHGPGSQNSETKQTAIEAARDPSNLNVTDIKATNFSVTWNKPDLKTGPTTYYLKVYEQENLTNNQPTQVFKTFPVPDFDTEEYLVNDVVSYWYYKVELHASTAVGNSSILNVQQFQTLSSAPGKVNSLKVKQIPENFRLAEASWNCLDERDRHGIIMNYTLTSTLENESPEVIQHQQNCEFRENVKVVPGEKITFELYATNMNFEGERHSYIYQALIGKPILPKEEDQILIPKTDGSVGQTSFSVTICASCLKDETNGPIKITAILVCVKDKCDINGNDLTVDDIKKFSNWKTAKAASFNSPYRVTNDTWSGGKEEVTIIIGEESESVCEKQSEGYFCNGPLNMDTEYQIIAVSCTDGGCTYSKKLGSFKTKAEDTDIVTPVVVSIVVILIVIAVIIGAIYLYKRRKNHQHVDEHSIHSIDSIMAKPTVPRYRPIKLEHFEEQLANLQKDSNLLFSEEFEGIGELSPKHESIAAQKDENKPKNRYVNILAFDHSRVKLLPIDDDETTDYINANYIPGYKSQREYIATQGPLITNVGGVDITTIPDFWRMIWEQRVAIIVMLSDLTEKGKPKVDKYWKDQGESEQYGDIVVEVTSVSVLNKYTIKIFELKLGEEVRKVRHFFLPGWEDYRANLQPQDVLEFLSVVRQEVKPIDKGPMVVHCSAGVGRTGTFIALDIFQQFINDRDMTTEIDIYDLVLRMRNFRQNMVQSEKQYIFIHETIKEIISQRRKRLQDNDTAIYENTGYSNEAFVPDDIYQNVENGKPTTTL